MTRTDKDESIFIPFDDVYQQGDIKTNFKELLAAICGEEEPTGSISKYMARIDELEEAHHIQREKLKREAENPSHDNVWNLTPNAYREFIDVMSENVYTEYVNSMSADVFKEHCNHMRNDIDPTITHSIVWSMDKDAYNELCEGMPKDVYSGWIGSMSPDAFNQHLKVRWKGAVYGVKHDVATRIDKPFTDPPSFDEDHGIVWAWSADTYNDYLDAMTADQYVAWVEPMSESTHEQHLKLREYDRTEPTMVPTCEELWDSFNDRIQAGELLDAVEAAEFDAISALLGFPRPPEKLSTLVDTSNPVFVRWCELDQIARGCGIPLTSAERGEYIELSNHFNFTMADPLDRYEDMQATGNFDPTPEKFVSAALAGDLSGMTEAFNERARPGGRMYDSALWPQKFEPEPLMTNNVTIDPSNPCYEPVPWNFGEVKFEFDPNKAEKNDSGKTCRPELIDPAFTKGVGRVLEFGARKYAAGNWAKGMEWSRLIGALERHILAFKSGEETDPETGECHLYHAGCMLAFLASHWERQLGSDDRVEKGMMWRGPNKLQSEYNGKV